MTVNTKLSLVNYMIMVDALVAGYFDENCTYTPHYGRLNAMRLFWNNCVTDHELSAELGHEITDATMMENIVADGEFIKVYESMEWAETVSFDFGSAWNDARAIVDDKKSTIGRAITAFNKLDAVLSPVLTPDNIGAVRALIDNVNSGKIEPKVIDKIRSIFNSKVI